MQPPNLYYSHLKNHQEVLKTRIRSDTELFGPAGSGIIVPDLDPDLTFLTRKTVKILQIFTQNGLIHLKLHRYLHITLENLKNALKILQQSFYVHFKFDNYLAGLNLSRYMKTE
jgi:hypothetical protein